MDACSQVGNEEGEEPTKKKKKKKKKLHTVNSPTVKGIKAVSFAKKQEFDTRRIKANKGNGMWASQGMEDEILQKDMGNIENSGV